MSGLAAGLARGLAMYGQGRMIADDREAERQRQEAERQRQMAMMKLQQEQFALQREQFEAAQKQLASQNAIAAEGRMNQARADGYRPVQEATRLATSLEAADALVPGLGVHGRAMQQQAATADRTVNGTAMARIGESDTERQNRMARQEQQGTLMQQAAEQNRMLETIRAQLPKGVRPLAVDLKTAQSLLGKYAEQRMAPPRQESPVSMQVIQTADGPMAFNPRTGQAQPITAGGQQVRGAGKAQLPTEGERKAAALFGVAQQGYETLEGLLTAGVDPKTGQRQYKAAPSLPDRLKQTVGLGVGNVITSDQQRQMSQAAQQMADMWLRYTSGAAVPETEVQRFALTFTPLPGDDPQTLQQKAAARKRMIGSLQQAAGRALNTPGREGTASANPLEDPGFRDFLQSRGINP